MLLDCTGCVGALMVTLAVGLWTLHMVLRRRANLPSKMPELSTSLEDIPAFVQVPSNGGKTTRASAKANTEGNTGPEPAVLVTGGCGILGSAVVRHLLSGSEEKGLPRAPVRNVVVMDLFVREDRKVAAVKEYVKADLATASDEELDRVLRQHRVGCVIHTAGVVVLSDNEGLLHNVHVVGTQRLVRACLRCGVRQFVLTSSLGAIFTGRVPHGKPGLSPDAPLPRFEVGPSPDQHPSWYSFTKRRQEDIVFGVQQQQRNSEEGRKHARFATCALRLPGVYGWGDPLMVKPILDGLMTHSPAPEGCETDFLYVENAAHAHCQAAQALREWREAGLGNSGSPDDPSGRAYHVTQGEVMESTDFWNGLFTACRPGSSPLKRGPAWVFYALAYVLEKIFAFTCGMPNPYASVWNLTAGSLGYMTTTLVLDGSSAQRLLAYWPLYSNAESFQHIRGIMEKEEAVAAVAAVAAEAAAREDPPGPEKAVDWRLPPLSSNPAKFVLDKLSGPGGPQSENLIVFGALLGGVANALHSVHSFPWPSIGAAAAPSPDQVSCAVILAIIDVSAAVQCITGTSKRWYHAGGRMELHVFATILVEVVLQLLLIASVFCNGAQWYLYAVVWSAVFLPLLCVARYTPLHLQRPVSVLCFLLVLLLHQKVQLLLLANGFSETVAMQAASAPGIEWFVPVIAVKYLVSHVPRHEPYSTKHYDN